MRLLLLILLLAGCTPAPGSASTQGTPTEHRAAPTTGSAATARGGAAAKRAASSAHSLPPDKPPSYRWTEFAGTDPQLDARMAARAQQARTLGLIPIVHVRTPWNSGANLFRHRDNTAVQHALQGFDLIEIDYDDQCLSGKCAGDWTREVLCGTYAQTFHAISKAGKPALPSASPGKFGPITADENRLMLDDYVDLVRRWKDMHSEDRQPCAELLFTERVSLPADLPSIDLCGPNDDTVAYLKQQLDKSGPRGVHALLAKQLRGAAALRVCARGHKRVLRANSVKLYRTRDNGVAEETLGSWGQPGSGTTWWRLEVHGKRDHVALIVRHLR